MKTPPFDPTGLHPHQLIALRDAIGVSEAEFGRWFGTSDRAIRAWEDEGLSTGPTAVAVRAVAAAVDFDFPEVEGLTEECAICGTAGYQMVDGLALCRSCFLTPIESMQGLGYVISQEAVPNTGRLEIEVIAPPDTEGAFPLAEFGPEDWVTAVKKLRYDEPQVGHELFDDAVFISSIEPETRDRLDDPIIRDLIIDLVAFGEVELIGKRVEVRAVRRYRVPPVDEIVRLCGLLIVRLRQQASIDGPREE